MKYSKIDIRNTVRNLIDYFKMQNEVPSQKEIVEVWSKIKEGVEKKKQITKKIFFPFQRDNIILRKNNCHTPKKYSS